ncbi:MAG TPA: nitroreductase/quinone reductase family protein, partial [Acidimicrobiales bacterium]|nr:nitroreductase/quinone reductase family protein [Acidimicrobiales bacterium]
KAWHAFTSWSAHTPRTPRPWWLASKPTAVAVLASNYGAAQHPAWYRNLVANPTTIAEIRGETWKVHARVAVADERRRLLDRIMAATPSAAAAVRNTEREIPVVVLDRLDRLDAGSEP